MKCKKCKCQEYRKGLCLTHWKESQGYVFDPKTKMFVKRGKQCRN